jgi:hypothetical protein
MTSSVSNDAERWGWGFSNSILMAELGAYGVGFLDAVRCPDFPGYAFLLRRATDEPLVYTIGSFDEGPFIMGPWEWATRYGSFFIPGGIEKWKEMKLELGNCL